MDPIAMLQSNPNVAVAIMTGPLIASGWITLSIASYSNHRVKNQIKAILQKAPMISAL